LNLPFNLPTTSSMQVELATIKHERIVFARSPPGTTVGGE
jgi:hypothetical protein